MAVDDYLESEVAVAAAATAVLLSPPLRGVMRKGLVYGTAGVMTAGDAVVSVAKGAGRGVQRAVGRGPGTGPPTEGREPVPAMPAAAPAPSGGASSGTESPTGP